MVFPRPAIVALLTALAAAPALADQADFPAATDGASLAAWLSARTNIKPASVVSVTPGLVVALVVRQNPMSPAGPVRVTLREEVIAPSFVQSVGGRSALISAEIQCEERRLRMDGRDLYAGPNLSGRKVVDEPSAEWLRIPEDTVMDDVANTVCEPNHAGPLQAYASEAPVIASQGPPPAPPAAVQPAATVAQAGSPAGEPKAENPAGPSAPAVRYAVQIGAYRDRGLAESAWKALSTERPVLTRGHEFEVRPVKVKGKELLRGLVLNFKSQKEGAAFCAALAGTGYGCILRLLAD